jgi:dihydroxyacetone kinase-like predicted kinase
MFRASTAHHQEVSCVYVANGTYTMTVIDTGDSLTIIADSNRTSTICHTHTLPPDDGLLMPETCGATSTQ